MTADSARRALRAVLVLLLGDLVFLQHGRFPAIEGLPVRSMLFVVVLALSAFVLAALDAEERTRFLQPAKTWLPATVLLLALAVPVWGSLRGITGGADWGDLFNDANGHLFYLAALPMCFSLAGDTGWLLRILQRLVVVFCVFSLLLYVAAISSPAVSDFVETNLRTRELGFLNEFTDGRPYRLFFKSYIFVVLIFGLVVFRVMARRASRFDWITLLLAAAVLWNAYTRSIWIVVAVMLCAIALLQWGLRSVKILLPAGIAAVLVFFFLLGPHAVGILRLDDRDGTAAIRFGQAGALAGSFLSRPLLGDGFGSRVEGAAGFSVELDLLNLARKIGIVGLAFYVVAFALPVRSAFRQFRAAPTCPEAVAVFAMAILTVFGMGAANPYATASLGIGAMCVALAGLSAAEIEPAS